MSSILLNPSLIFETKTGNFDARALELFQYQAEHNPVYREYLQLLKIDVDAVQRVEQIPFLPVELFKGHSIITEGKEAETIFESSGTTGQITSKHYVASTDLYKESFNAAFKQYFGAPEDMCILALLPSYLERDNSSLVYMVDDLISQSDHPNSGFFLNSADDLVRILQAQAKSKQPTLLIGVTFALLDLAEQFPMPLGNIMVLETGGMKGRRKELTRAELHDILKTAFEIDKVYSEYGMTELLSQGYTDGTEWFSAPAWMKILTRDPYDPLALLPVGSNGGINVIDLANIYSCPFIATGDLGRVLPNGKFSIAGRLDNSDIRGCNLMLESA